MTQFEKDIFDIVSRGQGIRASQIAAQLGADKKQVDAVLYKNINRYWVQDMSRKWYTAGKRPQITKTHQEDKKPDSLLAGLCRYYLNCLSLDEDKTISAPLHSGYGVSYVETGCFGDDCFKEESTIEFLNKIAKQRNLTAYAGYPVMVDKIFYPRTGENRLTLAPVFLFPIEKTEGRYRIHRVPVINMAVVKKYGTRDANERVYELIELENQLGLNKYDTEIEIKELTERLQQIRQWTWKENISPSAINITAPLNSFTEEGIFNRAIILANERSPFTLGLESELAAISKMSDSDFMGTALYQWIHGKGDGKDAERPSAPGDIPLLEVLPLNTEQEYAVREAMHSGLTIITGPPGTGKSQVVTELLVNTAWSGKKALFSSKNNKAVDVVESRLNSLGDRPVMIRIGNNRYAYHLSELVENMLSSNADQSDISCYDMYRKAYSEQAAVYDSLKKEKEKYISVRNKADRAEQKFCLIRSQYAGVQMKLTKENVSKLQRALCECEESHTAALKDAQSYITQIFWFAAREKRMRSFNEKVAALNEACKLCGVPPIEPDTAFETFPRQRERIAASIGNLHTAVEYFNALDELRSLRPLEETDKMLIEQKKLLAQTAAGLWQKWLAARPLSISVEERKEMSQFVAAMKLIGETDIAAHPDQKERFDRLQKSVTRFLPCWAVTSLSAKGRVPFLPGIFDVVIIDEASQCDIASALPLLYRAKRAVIIGDPRQLSHICSISKAQDLSLMQRYNVDFNWSYSANSLYAAASGMASPDQIIHLRDHHRSHEDIIAFSNKEFYDGKLRIATDYKKLNIPRGITPGIKWINVCGETVKYRGGGAYNAREAAAVISVLRRLVLDNGYSGSIGIVTPFRAQAETIREGLCRNITLKNYLDTHNDCLVDTVHKFQGDERDIIIFSPVISHGTQSNATSFLSNTGNLFNVAVTRAKAMLVVVGDMQYCAACGIKYLEHFAQFAQECGKTKMKAAQEEPEYTEVYPRVSNPEQVSEWEKYFYSALFKSGIKTIPQYPADKYRLDLALFSGDRRLDIEIDGEMYHKEWNGELCYRDQLRNQRLYELGWDVKRFWVCQIRDELQWCIEQIKLWQRQS